MRILLKHRFALETLYSFFGSQNRLAQRMVLPEIRREDFVDQVIRAVRLHLDFFEDDALLALDVAVAEQGVEKQVGQDVLQKAVRDLGINPEKPNPAIS